MTDANPQFLAYFSGGHSGESRKMARNEFVKARVSPEEKEIYQQLCEQAGCTEAELIRSVLIHREISLDDLDDEMQVLDRKRPSISNRRITGEHRHRVKPMNVASRFLKKGVFRSK